MTTHVIVTHTLAGDWGFSSFCGGPPREAAECLDGWAVRFPWNEQFEMRVKTAMLLMN